LISPPQTEMSDPPSAATYRWDTKA
jgi:hypothetical protein